MTTSKQSEWSKATTQFLTEEHATKKYKTNNTKSRNEKRKEKQQAKQAAKKQAEAEARRAALLDGNNTTTGPAKGVLKTPTYKIYSPPSRQELMMKVALLEKQAKRARERLEAQNQPDNNPDNDKTQSSPPKKKRRSRKQQQQP